MGVASYSEVVNEGVGKSSERSNVRKKKEIIQCIVFAFKQGLEDKKSNKENGKDFSREVTYNLEMFWASEAVEK